MLKDERIITSFKDLKKVDGKLINSYLKDLELAKKLNRKTAIYLPLIKMPNHIRTEVHQKDLNNLTNRANEKQELKLMDLFSIRRKSSIPQLSNTFNSKIFSNIFKKLKPKVSRKQSDSRDIEEEGNASPVLRKKCCFICYVLLTQFFDKRNEVLTF